LRRYESGHILLRDEFGSLKRSTIGCFVDSYLLKPGSGQSTDYKLLKCNGCPQGFLCPGWGGAR
jgi:hypothetical protein